MLLLVMKAAPLMLFLLVRLSCSVEECAVGAALVVESGAVLAVPGRGLGVGVRHRC